jgi:hypothetical protein
MIHAVSRSSRAGQDETVDERQRRIGENEVIFREVNERVRETNETFDVAAGDAEFVCECGMASCVERIRMTLAEYEHVRADPTQFLVVPGHEVSAVESVVISREDRFVVIRKDVGEPEALAVETDPRA